MEAYGPPTTGGAAGGTNDPGPIPPAVIMSGASTGEEGRVVDIVGERRYTTLCLSYPSSSEQAVAGPPLAQQGERHHSAVACPPDR